MKKRCRHHTRPPGVVLLITLVLLAIASVALAATARRSLTQALTATQAAEELQRRWATTSLRTTLAASAPQLLEQAQADALEPTRRVRGRLQLGSLELTAAVTDEQAAVNVNTLLRKRVPASVTHVVEALSQPTTNTTRLPLNVRVRPHRDQVQSPAQVFDEPEPEALWSAAPQVTCWGDGKLHWRRSSPNAMQELLRPEAGGSVVDQLLELRRDESLTLEQAIGQLDGVPRQTRQRLPELLTEQSRCFAVWIKASDPHRSWYSLHVSQLEEAGTSDQPPPELAPESTPESAPPPGNPHMTFQW
mgnify:CR=1 FL=1